MKPQNSYNRYRSMIFQEITYLIDDKGRDSRETIQVFSLETISGSTISRQKNGAVYTTYSQYDRVRLFCVELLETLYDYPD